MPNVHFELTADEQRFVQAMIKARRGVEGNKDEAKKLANELRGVANRFDKVGERGRAAGRDVGQGLKPAEVSLAGVGSKLLAITGAVGLAQKAFAIFSEEVKRHGAEAVKVVEALLAAVAGAGDIAALPEIRRELQGIQAPMGMLGRIGVYQAVRGEMPSASREQIMAIVKQAVRGPAMGMSEEDTKAYAATIATLSKLGVGPVPQAAALAKVTTEAFGKRGTSFLQAGAGVLSRFVAAGGAPIEGLATMLSALEAGQPAEKMGGIIDQLAGLKAVAPRTEARIPAAAQARLGVIEGEMRGMEARREVLRREGADLEARAREEALVEPTLTLPRQREMRVDRERREADFEQRSGKELEILRRREFDLQREREVLRETKETVTIPLSAEQMARNRLAGMPFAEKWATLLAGGGAEAFPRLTPALAAMTGRRAHWLGALQGAGPADLALQERLLRQEPMAHAQVGILEARARGEAAEEPERQKALTAKLARERVQARMKQEGRGAIAQKLMDWMMEAYEALGGPIPELRQEGGQRGPLEVVVKNTADLKERKSPLGGGQEVRNRGNE